MTNTLTEARPPAVRRTLTYRPTAQDQSFVAAARSAAVSTLIIMGLIGIFLLIGAWPALRSQGFGFLTRTDWLPDTVAHDEAGYILVGAECERGTQPGSWPLDRAPYAYETSLPGVFAVGDVRSRSVKRVANAVGEGSVVIQQVGNYLST